jgi:hypothetical protein
MRCSRSGIHRKDELHHDAHSGRKARHAGHHARGHAVSAKCIDKQLRGAVSDFREKWSSPAIPVFAVYPSRKFLPLRLNVFLQALGQWHSPLWTRD